MTQRQLGARRGRFLAIAAALCCALPLRASAVDVFFGPGAFVAVLSPADEALQARSHPLKDVAT